MNFAQKETKIGQLVIVRHGESEANLEGVFAGWVDTPLTQTGRKQGNNAGTTLRQSGFNPDVVYSSPLSRAIDTAKEALKAMGMITKPIIPVQELIERHYGALVGLTRKKAEELYGIYGDHRSPPMDATHPAYPGGSAPREKQVIGLPPNGKGAESLEDVVDRIRPLWENKILPRLKRGEKVLIFGHGDSLKALTMLIEGQTLEQIKDYEIPNAVPIKYDFTFQEGKEWKVEDKLVGQELCMDRPRVA